MNRIRELRQKKQLTQEELARLLGVDRSAVARWETGSNLPRAEKLITLARVFGCSVDELLTDLPLERWKDTWKDPESKL